MNIQELEKILGRKQYDILSNIHNNIDLSCKKILVTGANGSIGTKLCETLKSIDATFLSTDIEGNHEYLDITDFSNVISIMNKYKPDYVINLAGLKYAPRGEHETWKTLSINTIGVKNLLDASDSNCKVILASTCKSCNPEIVYGATKLIAERMVLNSKGGVARFYNVVETQGNVFEIWNKIKPDEPIGVVEECNRYFISISESVGLLLYTMLSPSGRYIINNLKLRNMKDVADSLYPNRNKKILEKRRGDRLSERNFATSEHIESYELFDSVLKIKNEHD